MKKCLKCGEEIVPGYESCWNCGTDFATGKTNDSWKSEAPADLEDEVKRNVFDLILVSVSAVVMALYFYFRNNTHFYDEWPEWFFLVWAALSLLASVRTLVLMIQCFVHNLRSNSGSYRVFWALCLIGFGFTSYVYYMIYPTSSFHRKPEPASGGNSTPASSHTTL